MVNIQILRKRLKFISVALSLYSLSPYKLFSLKPFQNGDYLYLFLWRSGGGVSFPDVKWKNLLDGLGGFRLG